MHSENQQFQSNGVNVTQCNEDFSSQIGEKIRFPIQAGKDKLKLHVDGS